MATDRKCPSCHTWNKDLDYCSQCNTLLSPKIIEEQREEIREKRRHRAPNKLELFLQRWKESKYWVLRAIYQILYTIGFIFFAIASFFAWLAASPNG